MYVLLERGKMLLFLAAIENEEVRSVMEIICEEYLEDMIRAANSILHNERGGSSF